MALLKRNAFSADNNATEKNRVSHQSMTSTRSGLLKGGSYAALDGDDEFTEQIPDIDDGIMELEEEAQEEQLPGVPGIAPAIPPPPMPQIDKMLIEEAEKKAEEIIKKARAEAKKLIEETKLYSQSAFSQAETDGFEKGKEEGFEAGKGEMIALIMDAKNVLNQVLKERELLLRSIEPEVAKLSVRIAEKIMKYQIDIEQEAVVSMIRAALETVKQREEVIIKINQEDYYYAKEKKDIFSSMIEGLKTLDIVVDSSVERGGCIIETNLGNVDARLSTQIHTLELAFDKVAKDKADLAEEAEEKAEEKAEEE